MNNYIHNINGLILAGQTETMPAVSLFEYNIVYCFALLESVGKLC